MASGVAVASSSRATARRSNLDTSIDHADDFAGFQFIVIRWW
jgi:hypothetical protein